MAHVLPKITAHKSYINGYVGNTYESIQAAVNAGVKAIEIDIRRTKDNIPVIFHDEDLTEATDKVGTVKSYLANEIIQAHYKHPEDGRQTSYPVTLLEPVLKDFGKDLIIFLEIKESSATLLKAVLDLVHKYKLEKNVVIESFSMDCLFKSRHMAPDIPVMLAYYYDDSPITYEEKEIVDYGEGSWLWSQPWYQKFARARLKPDYLAPRFNIPRDEMRDLINQEIPLVVWTVDDIHKAKELLEMGVTSVMTNFYNEFKALN